MKTIIDKKKTTDDQRQITRGHKRDVQNHFSPQFAEVGTRIHKLIEPYDSILVSIGFTLAS